MKKLFLLFIAFVICFGLVTLSYANLISIGSGELRDIFFPVYSREAYSYSQQIYYQNEINYKGIITKLGFRYYSGNFNNTNHWRIYMGHTNKFEFNNTKDWIPINNLIQVFDGDVSNYLSQGWLTITLTNPFEYNNNNNLVIAVAEVSELANDVNLYFNVYRKMNLFNAGIYYYGNDYPNLFYPDSMTGKYAILDYTCQIRLEIISPPEKIILISPDNGENNVSITPTLSWDIPLTGDAPNGYKLFFRSENEEEYTLYNQITTNYYHFVESLDYNTTYYWKVLAYNNAGEGPISDEWHFITIEDPPLYIEINSFFAFISNLNKVNLNWISQTETDLIGYYVLRGTNKDLSNAHVISPMINATNTSQPKAYMYTDNELNVSGTYYYWLQYNGMDGTIGFKGPIEVKYEANSSSSGDIPLVTSLDNVFPNPFNPIAYIPFSLENQSEVKIIIYNMRGEIVKTFDLGAQKKGHHRITWDGRDNDGNLSGNGIYYIIMKADNQISQRKAVLMK